MPLKVVSTDGRWISEGWKVWRCRIGKIQLKPGATLICIEDCGSFF